MEDTIVSCEFLGCWRHLPHAPRCRHLVAFSQAVPTHKSRRSPTCLSIGQEHGRFTTATRETILDDDDDDDDDDDVL